MTSFVLAHLSDPHLAPLPRPQPHELLGKRALGYLNWTRGRRLVHRRDVLDTLVADTLAQRPDHIAVTGDLVNIALPGEIAQAADWLHGLGRASDVTLVPGNHDAYVRGALAAATRAWGAYMQGDNAAGASGTGFPFVRRRGPLTMIGVSSAVPTGPFMATGRLGPSQLAALEHVLAARDDSFRVLLVHHPLRSARNRRHARLTDADRIEAMLRRHGVDLVLHGHDHRHALVWLDGPGGRIPMVGVPSASVGADGHRTPAAYHLFSIDRRDDGFGVKMTTRGVRPDGAVSEVKSEVLR
jgi:3',5'-cyclic AMP phosphodiesterase CpdA